MRETKGGSDIEKLRFESEVSKIKFGEAPYGALKVDYFFHHDPKVLIEVSPDYAKRGGM